MRAFGEMAFTVRVARCAARLRIRVEDVLPAARLTGSDAAATLATTGTGRTVSLALRTPSKTLRVSVRLHSLRNGLFEKWFCYFQPSLYEGLYALGACVRVLHGVVRVCVSAS
jgi:hypothetical protein